MVDFRMDAEYEIQLGSQKDCNKNWWVLCSSYKTGGVGYACGAEEARLTTNRHSGVAVRNGWTELMATE